MKVCITGATGWIGSGVLQQLLDDSSITSVLALARREPSTSSPKLSTMVKSDFQSYTEAELSQIKDCDAALWSMGNGSSTASDAEKEKVLHDYPHIFLNALSPHIKDRTSPFRFIWIGGQIACRDQDAKLWYLSDIRKTLGRWEDELLKVAEKNRFLDVYVVNIGMVTESAIMRAMLGKGKAITREETGRAFITLAKDGGREKEVTNARLVDLAG